MNSENQTTKPKTPYTTGEEIFNSVSHGAGGLLSIAAIVLLVVFAPKNGITVTSLSIYGASLIILYTMSCLYHAFTNMQVKKVFQIFDHVSIYLLIAGTYTPFCLCVLGGAFGWTIFGIIWGLAAVGITIYSVFGNSMRKMSSITYVIMGWIVIVAFLPLRETLPKISFVFLATGGVAYTAGFPFYGLTTVKWAHSIFHLFVLAGSVLHFFSVFTALCR